MGCSHILKPLVLLRGFSDSFKGRGRTQTSSNPLPTPVGTLCKDPRTTHQVPSTLSSLHHRPQCYASLATLPLFLQTPCWSGRALGPLCPDHSIQTHPSSLSPFTYFSSKHASLPDVIKSVCLLVCHPFPGGRYRVCPDGCHTQ